MPRSISIRRNLLVSLTLTAIVLGGGMLATAVYAGRHTVAMLTHVSLMQALRRTEAELDRFFEPIDVGLELSRSWGSELLDPRGEPDALDRLFVPFVERFPQIVSVLVADSHGREHMVTRAEGRWARRRVRIDEWGPRAHWREWSLLDGAVERWEDTVYDPRTRPWFDQAEMPGRELGPGVELWTDPYTFFQSGEPGITASLPLRSLDDDVLRVVAFDVRLAEISDFTRGLHVHERGLTFVVDRDQRVIGLPAHPRFEDAEALRAAMLARPDEIDVPVVTDAIDAVGGLESIPEQPFRFHSGGESWWGQAITYALSPGEMLYLVVVVPEDELLGAIDELVAVAVTITAGVLGLAVLQVVRLARRFSHPIEALARQSERIGSGDLDRAEPVTSDVVEVRRLAEAQDRMRIALRSLLKLESDLALARRIQQGTLPDALPRVPGYEIAACEDPAEETGGDTYDALGLARAGGETRILSPEAEARHALLLVADATGHGIGPALSATQVRAMVRTAVRFCDDLEVIAAHVNAQLHQDLPEGRFITAWLGLLDAERHVLATLSAGQAPLLHYDAAGDRARLFEADGPPLGVLESLPVQLPEPLRLGPGDVYAVISDGIYEAVGVGGEAFGADRVIEVVRASRESGAEAIVSALRDAVERFTGGAPAADDRTMLLVKRSQDG